MQAQVDGKPVSAHARLLDSERTVEFGMGEEISLEPGTHRVEVAVSDAETLVDKPSQQLEVFIEPGEQAKPVVSFPFARVQLNVLVAGRPQPGAALKLIRNGSVVADLKTSTTPILVTPGKYEADVSVQGATMRVKGLVFFEGSTQTVPVRAHF